METFIQQIINGLVLGSMYALVALGYTMVYGIINLINFAHGEVLMVGARQLDDRHRDGRFRPARLAAAADLAGGLHRGLRGAQLHDREDCLRPLRNAPGWRPDHRDGHEPLLQTLAMIVWKPTIKSYPILLPTEPIFIFGAVINTVTQIIILVTTAVVLAMLMYLVNRTKLGRAMRATAENPRVAGLMGVRPTW